ncbi:MAG: transposase, partial [Sweet potato little leaf phytoplasma]|nr:transposase [Sweet potato little leaf phytoplasma]
MKCKYRGTLIVATCLDGNNQNFSLAFDIVDRETDNSMKWFLTKLKGAIGEIKDLVFVTDQNSSFAKSIAFVFPTASHGLCVQHMRANLSSKFKNQVIDTLFYNASRAYRESKFQESWDHILAFDNGVIKYLEEVGLPHWAHMHCQGRRYNMMITNTTECMNAILLEARE